MMRPTQDRYAATNGCPERPHDLSVHDEEHLLCACYDCRCDHTVRPQLVEGKSCAIKGAAWEKLASGRPDIMLKIVQRLTTKPPGIAPVSMPKTSEERKGSQERSQSRDYDRGSSPESYDPYDIYRN